mgnify:CR=1 FL=1
MLPNFRSIQIDPLPAPQGDQHHQHPHDHQQHHQATARRSQPSKNTSRAGYAFTIAT